MWHVFDKLAGLAVTRALATPKRPHPLPEILSREETLAMLAAAPSTRDQLILGFLPFRDETATGAAVRFYRLFKTHILGRFLCLRRPSIRAG